MSKKALKIKRESFNQAAEAARSQLQLAAELIGHNEQSLAFVLLRQAWLTLVVVTHRRLTGSIETKGLTTKTSTDLIRSLVANAKLTPECREAVTSIDRLVVMGPDSQADYRVAIATAIAWLDETEPQHVKQLRARGTQVVTKPSRFKRWASAAVALLPMWLKGGEAR